MKVQTSMKGINGQASREEHGKLELKQEFIKLIAKGYSLRKAAIEF